LRSQESKRMNSPNSETRTTRSLVAPAILGTLALDGRDEKVASFDSLSGGVGHGATPKRPDSPIGAPPVAARLQRPATSNARGGPPATSILRRIGSARDARRVDVIGPVTLSGFAVEVRWDGLCGLVSTEAVVRVLSRRRWDTTALVRAATVRVR